VTEPDIRTPEEARRFAQKLRLLWLTLGISDCNMEEGSLRVDANVSIRPRGATELGTKSEVKNMNSFKSLHDALAYEIVRQAEELEGGGRIVQETRHWTQARSAPAHCAARKRRTTTATSRARHGPFEFSDEFIGEIRDRLPSSQTPSGPVSRASTACRRAMPQCLPETSSWRSSSRAP